VKIVCVGAGPAGLYFAILAKLRHPRHEVAVVERDPAGATYGRGVVFWDDLLDALYDNDPQSAREVRKGSLLWEGQQVWLPDAPPVHLGGYGYSIGRRRLLEILRTRAAALGVDVQYEHEVDDPVELGAADLVVASDGVGSVVRARQPENFGTAVVAGRNAYIWLGTPKVFESFVFAFERTDAGWIWFHAYPSAADTSTCIVECVPETWRGLGLDHPGPGAGTALLQQIFAGPLDGHALLTSSGGTVARWLTFRQITNRNWHHGNAVLLGDAAHTTHFTIGSGTKLAVMDAIALADVLPSDPVDLPAALSAYDERRRVALRPVQEAARHSMTWFENIDAHLNAGAGHAPFGYALWARRGRYAPWRYPLHLATQVRPLRLLRREVSTARRTLRARRRGELTPGFAELRE
jgi:2-polyprenyl-6-methoxyphenol hydroxylase-like FAD-dependent oxidoreductase